MAKKPQHSDKSLVIVESPAKARTISKYLGSRFEVESSIGHVRDLPAAASEIPPEYKQEPWARLGVNVDEGFKPLYVTPKDKKPVVAKLKKKLSHAAALYLATDEDREGEAIAWHLREVLEPKVPVRRMVFDEITEAAINRALEHTRDIDQRLVNAQEARRILDRLYGYEVSPVLWRKVGPKLSAGRVQSVATRLVVERERARMRFVVADYWDLDATVATRHQPPETVSTRLIELAGKRIAAGKDFEDATGRLNPAADVRLLNESEAAELRSELGSASFVVAEIAEKPFTNRPYPPFITSTLQQEAARKLRYGARRTMRLAQSLYENGHITYMRTDSTHLSQQAIEAARSQVAELYGREFLPDKPRSYTHRVKNAQEAHEAIRPAGESFRTPKSLEGELEPESLRLYDLIWKRTVASQMKDARGKRTTVRVHADAGSYGRAVFSASGKVIEFAGFFRAYVEGADDPEAELADQEKLLPALKQGERLDAVKIECLQHSTQPPARYTEASLIKELEDRGIGRPSTYATILQTIQDRGYVRPKGTSLVPTFTAFAVVTLLERHLAELVDYDFTARMENDLDAIANGDRDATPWLHDFYFGEPNGGPGHGGHVTDVGLKALIGSGVERIDPREISSIPIGRTPDGPVVVRVGRYGPYVQVGEGDQRASVPDQLSPDELTVEKALELIERASHGDRVLGEDPETGKPVSVKTGRFGPYVQLGDLERTEKGTVKKGTEPKMASLWPSMSIEKVALEDALLLLSFPRTVGEHPETRETITAQDGRYGPYVKMGNETRSLDDHQKLKTITLAEAIELFKQPKARGRRTAPRVLAEIGPHPASGAPIQLKSGRYGIYVTDGVINATLPKGTDPSALAPAEALRLLEAREQKLKEQGKDPRAKAAKKSQAAAHSTTTKRPSPKPPGDATPKRTASKKTRSKTTARATSTRAKEGASSGEFGAPPPGFAWTRTGKPVVETWPEGKLACPNCGSDLALKSGRFGPFFSCTNYPACKTSVNLRGEAKKQAEQQVPAPERAKPIPTDVTCDDCGSKMVIRKSRGRPFLGCSGFPACRSTKPLPPELEEAAAATSSSTV